MKLDKDNSIGIIALAGECDEKKILNSKSFFESLGYNVKLSKNIFKNNNYLAGSDEEKIEELINFYKDPSIKVILNARGGYGSIRLIKYIDYNIIKQNPKIIVGFSDITSLLLMIYKKTGQEVYHGPMACSDFGNDNVNNFTKNNFFSVINNESQKLFGDKIYKKGKANGILWGGNLSSVVSLCGQDFIPNDDFIFFTEDLNEPTYKIDKMFQQLINMEIFKQNCKAIILGDFIKVDNSEFLENYFELLATKLKIPIISGFKITHNIEKITIPIGRKAILENNILIY